MSSWEFFYPRRFEIRKRRWKHCLHTFALVYFFELLINISSQNTFLFGVKLSDYRIRIKRAASRSCTIIIFDAINRRQFFSCQMYRHEKLTPASCVEFWHRFLAPVSGECVRGFTFLPKFALASPL